MWDASARCLHFSPLRFGDASTTAILSDFACVAARIDADTIKVVIDMSSCDADAGSRLLRRGVRAASEGARMFRLIPASIERIVVYEPRVVAWWWRIGLKVVCALLRHKTRERLHVTSSAKLT